MQQYSDVVLDRAGNVQAGVSVQIKNADGTLATIYSDNGVTPIANPVRTNANGQVSFYAADGSYQIYVNGALWQTAQMLDQPKLAISQLKAWAMAESFRLAGSVVRNSDGAVTSANIEWPDGTTGVYTADTLSAAFPGATDAWHSTYAGTPAKTITQPAVTRDPATGGVTVQPTITIS